MGRWRHRDMGGFLRRRLTLAIGALLLGEATLSGIAWGRMSPPSYFLLRHPPTEAWAIPAPFALRGSGVSVRETRQSAEPVVTFWLWASLQSSKAAPAALAPLFPKGS